MNDPLAYGVIDNVLYEIRKSMRALRRAEKQIKTLLRKARKQK